MKHELNVYLLVSELVGTIKDRSQIEKVLRRILPNRITNHDIDRMIDMATKEIVPDYIGIGKL